MHCVSWDCFSRPCQTLYTGQHRLQQGGADVFRDWLPEVLLLEVVMVTTGAGEIVVGGGAVAVEARMVVVSRAGQGTNTKTRGKQETAPKQQEKLVLTMSAHHVS